LEYEPGDLTAIVEAGLRLSELQAVLAPHGQMLALDPPGDPTIGACLAGDLSGPRRHRYGAMRDLVIGVTVVLADGTIASSGGKVVKNVAGYDLGKLFSGSRGRLGLIARVALRLHPRPAASATVVVETDDLRTAWGEIHRSQLTPSAVDVLPPDRIALLFEGAQAAVDRQVETCLGARHPDRSVWDESAARQANRRPVQFAWQPCLLGRPGVGRERVEEEVRRPVSQRLLRAMAFAVLPHPKVTRVALPFSRLAPFRAFRELAPPWREPVSPPRETPAAGTKLARVGLLTGCVQSVLFGEVNRATARVLAAHGYEVVAPFDGCCGALALHAGRREQGLVMAHAVAAAFHDAGAETIVTNAAGCGSHLKDAGLDLPVADVSELLAAAEAP